MFDLAQLAEADLALATLARGSSPSSFRNLALDVSHSRDERAPDAPKCPFQRERAA